MPNIGERKQGFQIGLVTTNHNLYVWGACTDCGKERWVQLYKDKMAHGHCFNCANKIKAKKIIARWGKDNHSWKGGRIISPAGYIQIHLQPDDFFFPMAQQNGYVMEHRLVVAKALGRNLHAWEIVHHKGNKYPLESIENKQDNRYPENLQLIMGDQHNQITQMSKKLNHILRQLQELKEQNQELKKELRLLRWISSERKVEI